MASATTWTHRAQQGIRKGDLPKDEPDASQRFAQHPCLPGIRISTVAPFRPLLRFDRCPCPSGIHTHAIPVFRPALIPTWRPCFARHLYSPGDHISTGAPFRLTPCPHDAPASPGAHVCLAFAFRPLLRFDRCPCPSGIHTHLASLIRQAPMLA